tara:strand:- start:15533 stop:16930 length:1398 start_codon:yes stop_codon:yes gene_type:complete
MELKELTNQIDSLKNKLDQLRPISEEAMNRYMQKIRLDWNFHSNSIEGNTLTMNETRQLILHGITAKGKPMRDHIEMQGHNKALHQLEAIVYKDIKITENLIKDFHRMVVVEPYDGEAEINPGEYKKHPNYLYTVTGERIDFEPPNEVPRLMNELVNWLNNHIDVPKRKKHKYDLHPLLIACGFHTQFIKIHPFGDGNGRTARILMNLILMLTGYVPAIIKLDDRDTYYQALNESTLDTMEPLALFVGQQLAQSMEMLIKAAKGESIDEPDDLDKQLALLKKEMEGEDENNEIKRELTSAVFWEAIETWGDPLLLKLIETTVKFNDFYNSNNHRIAFFIEGAGHTAHFSTNYNFASLKNIHPRNHTHKSIRDAKVEIDAVFSAYKKGGINPFGCQYQMRIEFEKYHYKVIYPLFENGTGKQQNQELQKLLHQPLTEKEIDNINKAWGDTLYQHLVTNRDKLKNKE